MNTFIRLLPYLFLFIGLGLLTGAWYFYQSAQKFLANSVEARGEVVEMVAERNIDLGRLTSYYPRIRFKTQQGEEIVFKSSVTSLEFQNYQIGQPIDVLYLPENPQKAKIKAAISLWLVPSILGGIGLVLCLLALGILFYNHFHPKS